MPSVQQTSTSTRSCPRCIGGWVYSDDPYDSKADLWCLHCGEWIQPPHFKPLPYIIPRDTKFDESSWFIDEHGDIIDIIDQKIEAMIDNTNVLTVSAVAKKVGCSNNEARMTLDRLVRNKTLLRFSYGPMNRWTAYRKVPYGYYDQDI